MRETGHDSATSTLPRRASLLAAEATSSPLQSGFDGRAATAASRAATQDLNPGLLGT